MRRRVVVGILLSLAVCNLLWAALAGRVGPVVGAAAYLLAAILVLRSEEYRAAFFVGVVGFAVHLMELLLGVRTLARLEQAFLVLNTVLPGLLVWMTLAAWRGQRRVGPDGVGV